MQSDQLLPDHLAQGHIIWNIGSEFDGLLELIQGFLELTIVL